MIMELIDEMTSNNTKSSEFAHQKTLLPDPAAKSEQRLRAMERREETGAHDFH
jgi:hypothetical protein